VVLLLLLLVILGISKEMLAVLLENGVVGVLITPVLTIICKQAVHMVRSVDFHTFVMKINVVGVILRMNTLIFAVKEEPQVRLPNDCVRSYDMKGPGVKETI
jgi:hypothetical protein